MRLYNSACLALRLGQKSPSCTIDPVETERIDSMSPSLWPSGNVPQKTFLKRLQVDLYKHWMLYLMVLPAVTVIAVFSYAPMYGIVIAFKNFKPAFGIWGSPWVGMKNFNRFFSSYQFTNILSNTIGISLYSIAAGFPAPVLLALMMNQVRSKGRQRAIQTITYMPHFISVIVVSGMILTFLNVNTGLYGHFARALGFVDPSDLLGNKHLFSSIYVLSDIWQHTGWDSIIYMAALSSIDPALYEAAKVDGASEWDKILHIEIPSLIPTMVILLILRVGGLMNVGFDKVFLLQNGLNLDRSEVISTYVYKVGMINQQYSFSAAANLFNTMVNFVMLMLVNQIARRVGETSLW